MNLPFVDSVLATTVYLLSKHRPVQPLATLRLDQLRRVLVVLTTGMGDAILSTPVFPSLRRALPQADIRLFCRDKWLPLFVDDPDLNGLIPYHGKHRRLLGTVAALRQFAPELAVILHGNDPDILPLCYLAGARHLARIPTTGTKFGYLLSNLDRAEDRSTLPGRHYIDNRLRILDTLGIAATTRLPSIRIGDDVAKKIKARMTADFKGRPYWVYHAFAADRYKAWPEAKARALLTTMTQRRPQFGIVLTGSAQDADRLTALSAGLPNVLIRAGGLNIAETGALLMQSDCVVAPDTGVTHLAAALGAPVVALYAPTRADWIGPRGNGKSVLTLQKAQTCVPCVEKKCPHEPVTCMDQFSIDEVCQALSRALDS